MPIYIGMPMPGPLSGLPERESLDLFKAYHFDGVRWDDHSDRDDHADITRMVVEAGLAPLPILTAQNALTRRAERDPAYFGRRTRVSMQQHRANGIVLPYVCLWNEPWISEQMSPRTFADYVIAGATAVREESPATQILLGADIIDASSTGSKHIWGSKKVLGIEFGTPFFQTALKDIPPELYDGGGVHPYRNPNAPRHSAWGTRRAERDYQLSLLKPGAYIVPTEVGYPPKEKGESYEVGLQRQAAFVVEEIQIQVELGSRFMVIYTHFADYRNGGEFDFGLFESDRSPRPVAEAIRDLSDAA